MSQPKKKALQRSILRDIRGSFGRFFAIFAIIALGVGFFSGLRITTPAMVHTFDTFLKEHNFFDLKLASTIGWDDTDLQSVVKREGVQSAEGAIQYDMICRLPDGEDVVFKAHSITTDLNRLRITEGRLPETKYEVVLDSKNKYDMVIGDTLKLSDSNSKSTFNHFYEKEYTVVGFVDSPLYINFERGTTSLGNGLVSGFIYLSKEAFRETTYTEIYVDLDLPGEIYSDEYNDALDAVLPNWEEFLPKLAEKRLRRISTDPDNLLMTLWSMVTADESSMEPDTYVMTRNTNLGYACFESDSKIVEQVAQVFPVFFILVAGLVCMTTMTRMVEEQRGQIGVLKALGYSNRDILWKYTSYSGSASLLGCVVGYSVGIFSFPGVIWIAYHIMYIKLPMIFIFDPTLAVIAFLVAVTCSIGITVISCRYELSESAAGLMRPKAPKPGKRVFLERLPFIWNNMKFLHKVSARNILRYKGRFFMMVLGISGCTALLLTGFGLRDSINGFTDTQFGQIQTADLEVNFKDGTNEELPESLNEELKQGNASYVPYRSCSMDLIKGKTTKAVQVLVPKRDSSFDSFFTLETEEGEAVAVPGPGEIVISIAVSERNHIYVGDTVSLRGDDLKEVSVRVTGVFWNHIYNYVIASPEDLPGDLNAAYVTYPEGTDIYRAQTELSDCNEVTYVNVYQATKERFTKILASINYIVVIVILSAAGLAFVVLFNLTNINITERIREIATIKVLGFYPGETAQYIFRENFVLTLIGMLAGLGLGVLLHRFVMAQIVVDMIYFKCVINPLSFVLSIILTFVFTILVSLFMRKKLDRINMAESLKSVE